MALSALRFIVFGFVLFAFVGGVIAPIAPLRAQQPSTATAEQLAQEESAAWRAALETSLKGPQSVDLGTEGRIDLPKGRSFIPLEPARRVMRAMGNSTGSNLIGLVIGDGEPWFAVISYIREGHIKDDDAKNWDVDQLLSELKEGTAVANEDRRKRGFPELVVDGWAERPAYDSAGHRLVWAANAHSRAADGTNSESGVNYNTYLLGREGYLSLNLITDADRLAVDKVAAKDLLAKLSFVEGRRYDDFNASTDHLAEYGLAALIGGAAAKKLGLFAVIAAFAVKFAKVGIALVVAAGYGVWKWVRRGTGRPPEV